MGQKNISLRFKVIGNSNIVINQEVYFCNKEYTINFSNANEKAILKDIIKSQNEYYRDQKIDAEIEIKE